MALRLPNRPPRVQEVAAVVAAMAVITLAFAKWQGTGDSSRSTARPPATVRSTEVPSRQPLAVFQVYVGCGGTPSDVTRNGRHADMPITVFDHRPFDLVVYGSGRTFQAVTVQLAPTEQMVVVSGRGAFYNGSLSVGLGQIPVCGA